MSSRRHRVCILNVFSREKTNFIGFLNNWNFSPIFNYHVIWKKRERKRKDEEKRDCLKHLNDLIFQFTLISFFFFPLFPFRKLKRINLFTDVKVCSIDADSLVELAWSKQILLIESKCTLQKILFNVEYWFSHLLKLKSCFLTTHRSPTLNFSCINLIEELKKKVRICRCESFVCFVL